MRHDPRERLRRPLMGGRVRGETATTERLFARDAAEPRRDLVPARDTKLLPTLTLRRTTRLASPSPNAPLLIRIVRRPYALQPGGRRRVRWLPEAPPTFARVSVLEALAAARSERERPAFSAHAGKRPRAFAVRPSTWVVLPPSGEEA